MEYIPTVLIKISLLFFAMAISSTAASNHYFATYLLAKICVLLVCSAFTAHGLPAPQTMGNSEETIMTSPQLFYVGLSVLSTTSIVAARQNFSPFSDATKSLQEKTKYWNAVNSICPLVNEASEIDQLLKSANSTTNELLAMQSIMNNVINDTCEWMNYIAGAPDGYFNCSTNRGSSTSINSLCAFMQTSNLARNIYKGIMSAFNNLSKSVGKQKEWITTKFSGHPQAAAVVNILNTVHSYTCQLNDTGSVTC